jgi:hypothetical protein
VLGDELPERPPAAAAPSDDHSLATLFFVLRIAPRPCLSRGRAAGTLHPPLFKPHANHIFASTPRMLRAPRAALAAEGTEM